MLWVLALVTIVLAILGAFAANSLTSLLAYLVLVSVGTLLAGIAVGTEAAISASLYYLVHSTWMIAGLFLLADIIAKQRGELASGLKVGPRLLNVFSLRLSLSQVCHPFQVSLVRFYYCRRYLALLHGSCGR